MRPKSKWRTLLLLGFLVGIGVAAGVASGMLSDGQDTGIEAVDAVAGASVPRNAQPTGRSSEQPNEPGAEVSSTGAAVLDGLELEPKIVSHPLGGEFVCDAREALMGMSADIGTGLTEYPVEFSTPADAVEHVLGDFPALPDVISDRFSTSTLVLPSGQRVQEAADLRAFAGRSDGPETAAFLTHIDTPLTFPESTYVFIDLINTGTGEPGGYVSVLRTGYGWEVAGYQACESTLTGELTAAEMIANDASDEEEAE